MKSLKIKAETQTSWILSMMILKWQGPSGDRHLCVSSVTSLNLFIHSMKKGSTTTLGITVLSAEDPGQQKAEGELEGGRAGSGQLHVVMIGVGVEGPGVGGGPVTPWPQHCRLPLWMPADSCCRV